MSLRDLLEEYRYSEEFIYEGLRLDLSYWLKRLMEERGVTKKELAERMGVSPAYVTKIFSGSNISLRTVAKVLAALKVDAKLFLEERKERELKLLKFKTKLNGVNDESDAIAIAS
ncbi:helix-turn-helix domain-containing protein [Phorcysia thermohydrogeniphila]|uniref:Helix-turn-helix protein n=1 Tax=Phorcysia thermohydrogeniphila TaxID=936138 RepID=A0A4R1GEJ0_9BACT|nr:helix-turn-helix transcriptional regulator [Phorcysia thermohydrogeniphila]TCK05210.1 helix-turn-helix protein [Phorcysia thermohydrogeniphila]